MKNRFFSKHDSINWDDDDGVDDDGVDDDVDDEEDDYIDKD